MIFYSLFYKKVWSVLLENQLKRYMKLLRRYHLLYSINRFKFNKFLLLSKLNHILQRILGKK